MLIKHPFWRFLGSFFKKKNRTFILKEFGAFDLKVWARPKWTGQSLTDVYCQVSEDEKCLQKDTVKCPFNSKGRSTFFWPHVTWSKLDWHVYRQLCGDESCRQTESNNSSEWRKWSNPYLFELSLLSYSSSPGFHSVFKWVKRVWSTNLVFTYFCYILPLLRY